MDEGEHDKADAFYLDNDVFVLFHALHASFVAFEWSTGDSHPLPFFEILFLVDFSAGGIVCRQKFKQVDLRFGNDLYLVVFRVAVDPER